MRLQSALVLIISENLEGLKMTIGKRIKKFREEKHITASELAGKLGLPARTIGSYERGEIMPGSKFLALITDKFNLNINWLLSGRGFMFINQGAAKNDSSITGSIQELQEEIKFSNDDMNTLIEILKSGAGRQIIQKLIAAKRGSIEALESLIDNLEEIKKSF